MNDDHYLLYSFITINIMIFTKLLILLSFHLLLNILSCPILDSVIVSPFKLPNVNRKLAPSIKSQKYFLSTSSLIYGPIMKDLIKAIAINLLTL